MNETSYIFTMLFMTLLSNRVEHLTYEDTFPVVEKAYNHWLATDNLYGRYDHQSTYDSIEEYIKRNNDLISLLIP